MVTILSGIPGSGKSYLAAQMKADNPRLCVVSADKFFETRAFDPSLLGVAHAACFAHFLMMINSQDVVVDNTNLHAWEISPYMLGAAAFGVPAKIVRVNCNLYTAMARQIHDVPSETVRQMHVKFLLRDVLPFWDIEEV